MWLFNNHSIGSAVNQIDIKAIEDGVLTLSANRYRMALETSSVNFELKSEAEQDALISSFERFLNSMGGNIQIIIRTRELDLEVYIDELRQRANDEQDRIYQEQMMNYASFISSLVTVNRILSRSFYIVIALDDSDPKHDFELAKEQLKLRADIIRKSLQRLGMHVEALSSLAMLNLFYSYFNPETAKKQPITNSILRTMHSVLVAKE